MTDKKTLDAATRSAFEAGVAFARDEADGWPGLDMAPSADDAYRAWRERWTGRPHEPQEQPTEEVPKATVVRDLLLLVDGHRPVWLQEILSWNAQTREEVVAWASAVHLAASDNEGIEIPAMPEILKDPNSTTSDERCPYYRDRQHRAECHMPGRGHMARTGMEVGG